MSVRSVAARSRIAFTLLELLLTLSVLAAIASVVIPQVGLLMGDRRLVRAAEQWRVEMTRGRVDAMRQGRVLMAQGMIEGNSFRIKPYFSTSDATEAIDQTGSQSALLSGADQGNAVSLDVDSEAEELIELPEGISVVSIGVVSAARASEIEQMTLADQSSGWSRPILFYPDGSTSTASIVLSGGDVGRIVVKLRGITGDVTISEVLP
ncbi:MAG: prepilin-type cleavage/methylation domain-containing protein [Rubripirellula sp.]